MVDRLTIRTLWMKYARAMAVINSAIFMTLFFFVIITPLGLILRLFRRSPLRTTGSADSQWVPFPRDEDPRRPF